MKEIINENPNSLVDKTDMFFNLEEIQSLTLDDDGEVYLLDIDGDGDLDIFPQQYCKQDLIKEG